MSRGNIWLFDTSAFSHLDNVFTMTLNNALTTINDFAFESMTKIQEIGLKDSLKTIGVGCFKDCLALKKVTVVADNKCFREANGVLYSKPTAEKIDIVLIVCPLAIEGKIYDVETETKEYAPYRRRQYNSDMEFLNFRIFVLFLPIEK